MASFLVLLSSFFFLGVEGGDEGDEGIDGGIEETRGHDEMSIAGDEGVIVVCEGVSLEVDVVCLRRGVQVEF